MIIFNKLQANDVTDEHAANSSSNGLHLASTMYSLGQTEELNSNSSSPSSNETADTGFDSCRFCLKV